MKISSKIKFSMRDIFRNKQRTSIILFGIIISISLISGIIIAADNLGSYSIEKSLSTTTFDMFIDSDIDPTTVSAGWEDTKEESEDLNNALETQYVSSCNVFSNIETTNPFQQEQTETNDTLGTVIVDSEIIPSADDAFNVTSIFATDALFLNYLIEEDFISTSLSEIYELNDSQIMIDSFTANYQGISTGDNVSIYTYWEDDNVYSMQNLTVVGIIEILNEDDIYTAFYPDNLFSTETESTQFSQRMGGMMNSDMMISQLLHTDGLTSFVLANLESGRQIMANLSSSTPDVDSIAYRYIYQLDHDEIPIYDTDDLETTLSYIETRLTANIGFTSGFTNNLLDAILEVEEDLLLFEIVSLVVSIPAIVLGVYLTVVLYKLSMAQRRREFGLMKSKGGKSEDVRDFLLIEGGSVAFVGGIIGYLMGIGISYLILSQILGSDFEEFLALDLLSIDAGNAVTCVILSIAMIILSIRKPVKNLSELSISETVQYYNEEESIKDEKSKFDWILLILGLLPLLLLIPTDTLTTTTVGVSNMPGGMGGGSQALTSTLWDTVESIASALNWFAPVLLTYAIVKILFLRNLNFFRTVSNRIASIFSKKTKYLVSTNIMRNPKRSCRIVMIITISICFGIMAQIVAESQDQYQYEQVYLSAGADINISGTDTGFELAEQIAEFTSDIDSISTVTMVSGTSGTSTESMIRVYGLDVDSLIDTSDLISDYFYDEDPEEVLNLLDSDYNGALLSEDYANSAGYMIGDNVAIEFSVDDDTLLIYFELVGYMQLLPGVTSNSREFAGQIFVNQDILNDTLYSDVSSISYTYLVDLVDDPVNSTGETVDLISEEFSEDISRITSYDQQLENYLERESLYQNIVILMEFQFPFLLIIATFGILILTVLSIYEKRREMALMRVRGVPEKEIIKEQLSEGFVLIVIGVVVGTILGFLMAYLMNTQLDAIDTMSSIYGLSRPFSIPVLELFAQILIVPAIFLAIIWLITKIEMKQSKIGRIAEVLRLT